MSLTQTTTSLTKNSIKPSLPKFTVNSGSRGGLSAIEKMHSSVSEEDKYASSSDDDEEEEENSKVGMPLPPKVTQKILETPASLRETPSSLRETPSSLRETHSSLRETHSSLRETPSSLRETHSSLMNTSREGVSSSSRRFSSEESSLSEEEESPPSEESDALSRLRSTKKEEEIPSHPQEDYSQRPRKIKYTHLPEGRELKKKMLTIIANFEGTPVSVKFEQPSDKLTLEAAREHYEMLRILSDRFNSNLEAKFSLLQQNNPTFIINIPDRTLTFRERNDIYDEYVKNIVANYNAANYQYVLWFGFLVIEYIAVNHLKLPVNGYAQIQITSQQRYQKMLIELGRPSVAEESTPVHPLIKIGGLALFQLVCICFINWISGKLGDIKMNKFIIDSISSIGDVITGTGGAGIKRDSDGFSTPDGGSNNVGDIIKNVTDYAGPILGTLYEKFVGDNGGSEKNRKN